MTTEELVITAVIVGGIMISIPFLLRREWAKQRAANRLGSRHELYTTVPVDINDESVPAEWSIGATLATSAATTLTAPNAEARFEAAAEEAAAEIFDSIDPSDLRSAVPLYRSRLRVLLKRLEDDESVSVDDLSVDILPTRPK